MRKYNRFIPLAFVLSLMATAAISGHAGAFLSSGPALPLPPAASVPGAPWMPPVGERESPSGSDAEPQRKPVDRGNRSGKQEAAAAPHKSAGEKEDRSGHDLVEAAKKHSGQQIDQPPVRGSESEKTPGNNAVLKPGENFEPLPGDEAGPSRGQSSDQNAGKLPGAQPKPAPDSPDQLRPKPHPVPWRDPMPRSHDRPWIDVLPDLPL